MANRFLIAEVGSVHDGSFGNACKLIDLAASCGADVVKFQTHIAAEETLCNAPSPAYFNGETRFDYFQRTSFSIAQWQSLMDYALNLGIQLISSPFSIAAISILEYIGVGMYKVPSGEVTNIPLLEKLCDIGKPVILSSGMSCWQELDTAVEIFKGNVDLTVMQCTSAYPCPPHRVGLNIINDIQARYGDWVGVGFSDHTSGIAAGPAAAAVGANVIEKHLTFSRHMYGSDASNALEPQDFTQYSTLVRETWQIVSNPVDKNDLSSLSEMKVVFEKSIVAARPLSQNSILTLADLAFKKPGDGISAFEYQSLIGRQICRDLPANHKFSEDDFK